VLSVPKCVEIAVGGCWLVGIFGIVNSKGEDEVEVNIRAYGHVGEIDSLEVSPNILAK